MSNTFQQAATTTISNNGFNFQVYEWSTAANWTSGVPQNGGAATVNVTAPGNPSGYDDIANLYLDSLYQQRRGRRRPGAICRSAS
ncbi:hypothetical protein [Rhodoblastus sp.]|uniref:hypothetical protein n=1 Tax=Rhodoblastus sp. TaxID=1962975 RepID=UPI002629CC2C|nr:hypothetical protein [Rhodoblastus sp.]